MGLAFAVEQGVRVLPGPAAGAGHLAGANEPFAIPRNPRQMPRLKAGTGVAVNDR
jgi:hypothetical protein